ncbi:MAG TPA: hypothetical protein VF765_14810 [Polyangiaceae bacterium]
MKRQALSLLALGGAMGLAACGNILGLKDLEPYPNEGGTAEGGGDDGAEESTPDGPITGDGPSSGDAKDAMSGGDVRGEEDQSTTGEGSVDAPGDVTSMDSPPDTPVDTNPPPDSPGDTNPPPDSPTCTSPNTQCGTQCVDLTSDGGNCGRCGHDCLGGMCINSVCQPVELLSGTTPFDIVVVKGGVAYWVDQASQAWSCVVGNCLGTDAPILSGLAAPTRIAWDGNATVFWTNNGNGGAGSIEQYTIGSGAHTTLSPAGVTITAPQGIVATTQYVFWTDTASALAVRYDRTSGMGTKFALGSGAVPAGMALCAGGTRVCWTDEFTASGMMGNVTSIDVLSWTSPAVINGSQDQPWSITDNGTQQFWVNYDTAGAGGAVVSSTGPTVASQDKPVRIVSDSTAVFWTNQGSGTLNGSLMTAAPGLAPSSVKTLVPNLASPVGLAIDSTAVYYGVTGSNGTGLWMVARP